LVFLTRLTILAMQVPFKSTFAQSFARHYTAIAKQQICIN